MKLIKKPQKFVDEIFWSIVKYNLSNHWQPVKSPESHLARSHVARNPSHVARNFGNVTPKKVNSPKETNTKKIRISDCK